MKILLAFALLGSAYAAFTNVESFQPIADEVNRLQSTWKAENNFPPHVTFTSLKKLLGVKKTGLKLPSKPRSIGSNIYIPEEFDARKHWPNCPSIGHIRDQGTCGSCWAVAAAGALSDRLCIATNGSFTAPLSDQELLSCCAECGNGCTGGDPQQAWYFFYINGLVTGGDYNSNIGCQPYSIQACEHHTKGNLPQCSSLSLSDTPECKLTCTNPTYENSFMEDHHRVNQMYSLAENSIREIQEEIMKHGPVEADFLAYADFPMYRSGVYSHVTGPLLGGHAVRIIGWGTENGIPYWLVANSWNTHWGDNGLFKIRRGVNECNIESNMVAGIPRVY